MRRRGQSYRRRSYGVQIVHDLARGAAIKDGHVAKAAMNLSVRARRAAIASVSWGSLIVTR